MSWRKPPAHASKTFGQHTVIGAFVVIVVALAVTLLLPREGQRDCDEATPE